MLAGFCTILALSVPSAAAEATWVSTAGQVQFEHLTFGQQHKDYSFGRSSSDQQNWVYFESPSPGSANSAGVAGICAPPGQSRVRRYSPTGSIAGNSRHPASSENYRSRRAPSRSTATPSL